MSGRPVTIRTSDGTEYEVPEENAEAAMRRFDQLGVKFSADNAPRAKETVELPEMQITAEPRPWYKALAEGAEDAVSGLTHGATMHNDATIGDLYGKGDAIRARNAEAADRSPNVFGTAEMVGGALPNLYMGAAGLAGRAGSALSNIGAQGLQGLLGGAARGYGDSDPDADPEARASSAAGQAMREGGIGAGISGGFGLLGAAGGAVRDVGKWAGDRLHAAAYGAGKYLDDLGMTPATFKQETSRLGLDRAWPQTPTGRLGQAQALNKAAGAEIGATTAEADALGVGAGRNYPSELEHELLQRGVDAADAPLGNAAQQANAYGRVADQVAKQPVNGMTDLRRLKTAYENAAYKGLEGSDETLLGTAHQAAADVARDKLHEGMQQAGPGIYGRFADSGRDFGSTSDIIDMLRGQNQRELGGQVGNLANGAMSMATGNPVPAAISMARNASGLLADTASIPMRAVQGIGTGVATPSNWIAQQAPTAAATAAVLEGGKAPPSYSRSAHGQQQAVQQSRGYLLPQQIGQALQSAPQVLGPYAEQLSAAKDEEELEAMIERLRRTDPRFETQIIPRFQQAGR